MLQNNYAAHRSGHMGSYSALPYIVEQQSELVVADYPSRRSRLRQGLRDTAENRNMVGASVFQPSFLAPRDVKTPNGGLDEVLYL